jgi:hypothetical protein
VKDIVSFEALVPGKNIARDVAEGVADVEAGAAGIWEHVQHVIFRTGGFVGDFVSALLGPYPLPFLFYFAKIVIHADSWFFVGKKLKE